MCHQSSCSKVTILVCSCHRCKQFVNASISKAKICCLIIRSTSKLKYFFSIRLRAVPPRSVTSKLGRTGESELTERGTGERREEEGLPSLLNQTCSGNSAHQGRQPVKNKLICHLISNNSASICRALNPHGFAALK